MPNCNTHDLILRNERSECLEGCDGLLLPPRLAVATAHILRDAPEEALLRMRSVGQWKKESHNG